jgi:hypothetical protein
VFGVLAFLAAILRSVAYVVSFDDGVGYFDRSFITTAAECSIVVACLFAVTGFIFINKKASLPKSIDNSPNAVFFVSVFAGFIMVADFVYKIFAIIADGRIEYYSYIFNKAFRAENAYVLRVTAIIEIFGTLSALLAAVWFFLHASKKIKAKLITLFGFFPVIRALTGIATVYFDMEIQMNHPSKLILQLALISSMLYFLNELRFAVSEEHPRPRRYFVSGCLAVVLCIAGGSSEMIGFFSGCLLKGEFCVEAFFCLTVGIYILANVITFVKNAVSLEVAEPENADVVQHEK